MPVLTEEDSISRLEQVRQCVKGQLAERSSNYLGQAPVFPWNKVARAQSYVLDLPAAALRQIRLHTDNFDGALGCIQYLVDPNRDGEKAVASNGYLFLGEGVPVGMWARESDVPGLEDLKFGFNWRGFTINDVTVQRQQNVCNLYRLLKASPQPTTRCVFLEIGAGYGSFALDALRVLADCTYVVVDLPESVIVSASYLVTHRPDART
jgi:hypothetical protein